MTCPKFTLMGEKEMKPLPSPAGSATLGCTHERVVRRVYLSRLERVKAFGNGKVSVWGGGGV